MAVRDPERVSPFNPFNLYKLMKRAGFKGFGSKEFSDLDYLKAAGDGARIWSIKCWFTPKSGFFNGLQVTYYCANNERLKAQKNMVRCGEIQEDDMVFRPDEVLESVTVYFAHFVCGIRLKTDKRDRLFGTDQVRKSTTLQAPAGTAIMAFYGSTGRLFETLGCYVVTSDLRHSKRSKSGHRSQGSFGKIFGNKTHFNTQTLSEEG